VQLGRRDRLGLAVQRAVGRLLSPVWVPATIALMRFGMRWRIEGMAAARREYRSLWGARDGPLLVCANHLTMIDSALIAWALGSPGWFLAHYGALPWNVPERRNFGGSLASRLLVYLMKCVPVTRGGDRAEVAGALGRLVHLLGRGEAVLVFPEGGRSRSGRVDVENATYGVGRMIGDLPRCRVLCIYLRGAPGRIQRPPGTRRALPRAARGGSADVGPERDAPRPRPGAAGRAHARAARAESLR